MGWFSKKAKEPPPPPPPFAPPKPESESRTRYLESLFRGGPIGEAGEAVVEVRAIGELHLPSGRIIACDPLVPMDTTPFTTVVPAGTHPVELAIARMANGDERIAAARLRFADENPELWLLAFRDGQNPATLKADEIFGYGVDAGMGCFMDAETFAAWDARIADLEHDYYELVLVKELERNYQPTRDWTLTHPIAGDPRNVALFSSGWGDGFYGSYFGMKNDAPVCLVTDFAAVSI